MDKKQIMGFDKTTSCDTITSKVLESPLKAGVIKT
jgi:hypothetical protein